MNVIQTHHVEPEVTIRLTRTEANILRSALYHVDIPSVTNGASVSVEQFDKLNLEFIDLVRSL